MLLVLDRSIGDVLASTAEPDNDIIGALENIANARREGKHLVFAERATLDVVKGSKWLSDQARRVYGRIHSDLPQLGVYRRELKCRLEVVADTGICQVEEQSGCRVMKVSATYLRDFSMVDEAVFLCENLVDTKFYRQVAKAYLFWSRLGRLVLRPDPRGGGGQNTADEYESIRERRNRLCLCVLDSDRRVPCDGIGQTARAAKHVDEDGCQPLCELVILDVREAENLIPTVVFQETVAEDPNRLAGVFFLEKIESHGFVEARKYLDIKKGMKLFEIVGLSEESPFYQFWHPMAKTVACRTPGMRAECWSLPECDDRQSCRCVIAQGLGEGIMDDATAFMGRQSPQKVSEMVCKSLRSEWEEIGEIVVSWFCGSQAMYAL